MFKKYIAERQFYKTLFIIILPIILQFFIQNFINLLDNIMVGQLGDSEIAAVGIANQYYKLFYPTIVSICTGAAIFTSQYFGSNKVKELQKIFGFKLLFPMLVTFMFLIFGFSFSNQFVNHFHPNIEVEKHAVAYLRIALWSYIPLTISTAFTFTFRPLKLTHLPMIASSVGLITNSLLNYCLIYGNFFFPRLGVEGAAIGTVVARVIELSIYIYFYMKNDYIFKTKFRNYFDLDIKLVTNTLKKVFPLFINEFANSYALFYIYTIYYRLGTSETTAITITDAVTQMVFIFANGLGTATSILVGYKLGQNDLEGAEKNGNYLLGYSAFMGFIVLIVLGISGFIVPHFYNISDAEKHLTSYAILVQALFVPALIMTRIPIFILRSGGRVTEVVFLNGIFMWIVKIPVALLFGYVLHANLILLFFSVEATRVISMILSLYFLKQKKWLKNLT